MDSKFPPNGDGYTRNEEVAMLRAELDQICPDCGAPIRDHMIGGPAPYHPRPIKETDLGRRISRLRAVVNGEEFDWEINGGSPFDDAKALLTEYDRLRAEIDNLRGAMMHLSVEQHSWG